MRKVMVFGVFDGVHDGHRALFREAKKHGDYLIAVLTQDTIVECLKGHLPKFNLGRRVDELQKEKLINEVALGDAELGSYGVVLKHRPEIIALGYDQETLKKNLEENLEKFNWHPKIKIMKPYKPAQYHSGLLN